MGMKFWNFVLGYRQTQTWPGLKVLRRENKVALVRHRKYSTVTPSLQDDPRLWVTSSLPGVPVCKEVEIQEMVFEQMEKFGNLPAITCGISGKTLKYSDIYRQARGFGAALIKAGFKRGDVAGVVLSNIVEFPVVLFGCWSAGLIVSTVNPGYTQHEIKRQLQSSEAKVAITGDQFLGSVLAAKEGNPRIQSVIVISDGARRDCHSFSEMVKSDPGSVVFATGQNTDTTDTVAVLPYSSGTTGPPKGVMLTHSNVTTNLQQFIQKDVTPTRSYEERGTQERLVGLLPFFHLYGFTVFLITGFYQGSHVMALPRFTPETFLKAIREHKPTCLHLVTPLLSHIANSPDYTPKEMESVHSIHAGAAPIGLGLINKVLAKADHYMFFAEIYGMTELSPMSHCLPPSSRQTKLGSCGPPIPSTWSKVIDTATGKTLGPHEKGEVLVKGPQVMKGYWRNEEATRNTVDAEGWIHTGDIGYYDEQGYFYIVDRLKELIKVKAFQVAPSELEDLLRKHDKIADCAVIGVPSEESGELPRAYVVVKPDTVLKEEEVHAYLKPQVASFKQLKGGIEFISRVPKSPSGKILRRELSAEYKERFVKDAK